MIKFFRTIRKNLLNEGKTSKYLKYAVGEIVLVVIGILIALQINNWNEKEKEEEKTKLLVEQVYSAIKRDNDKLESNVVFYNAQLKYCDILLKNPDSLSDQKLVEMLYYLDALPNDTFEADKFANELNFERISKNRLALVAQIKNFLNGNDYKQSLSSLGYGKENIRPILLENGITEARPVFGFSSYFDFNQYQGWFDPYDLTTARALLDSDIFRKPIKSVIAQIAIRRLASVNIIEDGNYLIKQIKKEFQDLRLMYEHVGIIGSSLPDGYEKSVPMLLMDEYQSIWALDVFMNPGTVKFRTRDSWTQNWGGMTFPNGYAQSFGRDIQVNEPGQYHIELNLEKNTYVFKKIKTE